MIEFVKNGTVKVPYKDGTRVEIKEIKNTRTGRQNSALHLYFGLLAEHLNNGGFSLQQVVKVPIEWSADNVKEHLWKPVQKFAIGSDSTKLLKKVEDIELIHDTLTRMLASKGIENVPFPSNNDYQFTE